jgi:hypothetical protein
VEALHDLNIQGLQRVTGGLDEENTGVDAVVHNVHAVNLVLSIQVGIETLLNVVCDWSPRLVVVDKITKTGGVNDGQSEANTRLLNICTDRLDSDSLGKNVEARALTFLGWVERGVEKRVHERRLSETRLA